MNAKLVLINTINSKPNQYAKDTRSKHYMRMERRGECIYEKDHHPIKKVTLPKPLIQKTQAKK